MSYSQHYAGCFDFWTPFNDTLIRFFVPQPVSVRLKVFRDSVAQKDRDNDKDCNSDDASPGTFVDVRYDYTPAY